MVIPNAPLFRDPIYDGAADPTVIYNRNTQSWWIVYTNRVTTSPLDGVEWVHGTDLGVAESTDGGRTWVYRGILNGLCYEKGRNTYWAPEIVYNDGIYHMYVSYVRGVPSDWNHERFILHYTSENLWDWTFCAKLDLSSDKVIDAAVMRLPDGNWRMWYKDEAHGSHTWAADSSDLYHWTVCGEVISDCAHEGVNVFDYEGKYWMITDEWHGLGVYCSDDCEHWVKQENRILETGGKRRDDSVMANHADVLVNEYGAYIFYFTHPERKEDADERANQRRSSIQAAKLEVVNGILVCDRDAEFDLKLS